MKGKKRSFCFVYICQATSKTIQQKRERNSDVYRHYMLIAIYQDTHTRFSHSHNRNRIKRRKKNSFFYYSDRIAVTTFVCFFSLFEIAVKTLLKRGKCSQAFGYCCCYCVRTHQEIFLLNRNRTDLFSFSLSHSLSLSLASFPQRILLFI